MEKEIQDKIFESNFSTKDFGTAGSKNGKVTWDEMINGNEKLEVDFTGLKE